MGSRSGVVATVKAVRAEFSEKNVTFMAGSIAYNAFVSLAPLLVVLLLTVRLLGAGELESTVIAYANRFLTPVIATLVETFVRGSDSGRSVSVIGVAVTVWGSLKIFRNLDTAFSEIFESNPGGSIAHQFRDALVVLFALVVSVVGMLLANAGLPYVAWVPNVGVFSPLVLVVGLCIAFFPLFYVFPDVDLAPREVVPGVTVAAVGWMVMQFVFHLYVDFKFDDPSGVATLGLLILFVTWLYFSGLVLLIGAVINAVLTGHAGDGVEHQSPATTADTHTVAPDDAAPYLSRLRADVTRDSSGPYSTDGRQHHRPRPTGTLHVEEQSVETDDGAQWEVVLRYPYDGHATE